MSHGDAHRDFIEKFRDSTRDRLERMTLHVLELEANPSDDATARELTRELHTLKGEAKMMGFADINLVAHRIEDLVRWALDREMRVPKLFFDVVLTGFDNINMLVNKSAVDGDVVDLPEFMAATNAVLASDSASSDAPPSAPPVVEAPADAQATPAASAAETDDDIDAPPSKDLSRVITPADEPTRFISRDDDADTAEPADEATSPSTSRSSRGMTTTRKIKDSSRLLGGRADETTIRVELDRLDTLLTLTGDLILSHERATQRVGFTKSLRDRVRSHIRDLNDIHRHLPHFDDTLGAEWASKATTSAQTVLGETETEAATLASTMRALVDHSRDLLNQVERLLRDLRDDSFRERHQLESLEISVRELRLLPIGTLFRRYPRAVRDLAKEQEKEVNVVIHGENVELDKRILDQISEPLLHLIRNAIDHGIERPSDRVGSGKPPTATLSLTARHVGAAVEIEVADNGRGVSLAAVKRVAIERGVLPIEQAERLDQTAALDLIFAPGFSTSATVSQISGRGVGLDVVRQKIDDLGGTVLVHSVPTVGTRFVLVVPVRVAIAKAQIIRLGHDRFAIPADEIEKFVIVAPDELEIVGTGRGLRFRSTATPGTESAAVEMVPVSDLSRLVNLPPLSETSEWRLAVINHGGRRLALRVDDLLGEQEIVRRPFDRFLAGISMFSGTTILPDGGIAPILNVVEVMRITSDGGRFFRPDSSPSRERESALRTILIVEDSEITRELVAEILRGKGFHVNEARNGLDGLEKLAIERPDLVITDVDMPEMTGFEMLEQLRAQPEFYNLPVVVLTTRGSEDDKRRALSLGANAYLVKTEFQEDNLTDTVDRLIGRHPPPPH